MAKVVLEHVTKRYGDFVAVNDLSMEIRDKEFFVLLGPSGCGKSTVLRLIAGLEQVTSGAVRFDEKVVNQLRPWERGVAMAFEAPGFGLFPNRTAYENMAFGLRKRKPDADPVKPHAAAELTFPADADEKSAIRRRVEDAAGRFGLSNYLGRKQNTLSAGHRQAVALSRAVTRQPQVFLLDDPLSQIDASMRASDRAELRRLHHEVETTIVYVTHDQIDAMSLGHRIAVLKEGVLQQLSTPQTLYERPANTFVATFIGSPPMNLLRLDVTGDQHATLLRAPGGDPATINVPLSAPLAQRISDFQDRTIIAGIRPEAIHEVPTGANPAHITGQVQLTEYTGHESYVHLRAAAQTLIARLANTSAVPGDTITLYFDPDNIYAFDPHSERNLL